MTSISGSLLHRRRERDQHDVTCLLDGFGQAPLMGRADAGDAPGRDFAALGNEGVQEARILVIDVVDFIDAEPAHFFAPELLCLAHHGFVAAGGTRGTADGAAASGFCHNYSLPSVDSGAVAGGAPGP